MAILGGGIFFYQKSKNDEAMMMKKEKEVAMMKDQEGSKDDKMKVGYKGKVLAGKSAHYLEFNQEDYETAQKEGKIIFLDFYANWCPICRAEAPEIAQGFNDLTTDKVIGFRVNFKDSDTEAGEKKLAEKFEIPYQHYKVILKSGKVVLKTGAQWTSKDLETALKKALGQ